MPPKKCELVLLLTQLDSLLRVRQAWTLSEKSQASGEVYLGSIVAATNYCILVYHCNIQELWHTNISVVHQSLIKDIRIQLPKNGKTWRGPGRSIHEPGDRVIVEGDIDCQLPPVGPEPWRWNDHKADSSLVHPGLKISGLTWYFSTFSTFSTLLLWIPLALLYSMNLYDLYVLWASELHDPSGSHLNDFWKVWNVQTPGKKALDHTLTTQRPMTVCRRKGFNCP